MILLNAIVWAGPHADWTGEGYEGFFDSLKRSEKASGALRKWEVDVRWGREAGVSEGEGIAIARSTYDT
jgi:hypothetical protein